MKISKIEFIYMALREYENNHYEALTYKEQEVLNNLISEYSEKRLSDV